MTWTSFITQAFTIRSNPHPRCSYALNSHKIDLPVSPFRNLLHTDYIVPANQHSPVHQTITTAQAALTDLQHKKLLLMKAVEIIQAQEIGLKADICAHQAMLSQSALRRMPYEILGQIFLFALDEPVLRFSRHRKPVDLFRLTHVCQRWRRAAFLQSGLWSRLRLRLDGGWRRGSQHQLLRLCLQRSGTRALIVFIEEFVDYEDKFGAERSDLDEMDEDGSEDERTDQNSRGHHKHSSEEDPDWVCLELGEQDKVLPLSLLKQNSTRITQLTIYLDSSAPWNIMEDSRIQFPSLVSLHIFSIFPNFTPGKRYRLFSTSLALAELSLVEQEDDVFDLPFETLSRYNVLGRMDFPHYAYLERALNIRTLRWSYDHPDDYPYSMYEIRSLVLPNVRQLIFDGVDDKAAKDQLPFLQLPLVEEVSGLYIGTFCTHTTFKTTQSLTALSLLFKAYRKEKTFSNQIKHLLGVLPHIELNLKSFSLSWDEKNILSIWLSTYGADFEYGFITLIKSFMDPGSFPNLETLSLSHMPFDRLALKLTLLRMVSKRQYPKDLNRLSLHFFTDVMSDSIADFRQDMALGCRNTGLTVTIDDDRY